jgi:serine/threonine protein kinase
LSQGPSRRRDNRRVAGPRGSHACEVVTPGIVPIYDAGVMEGRYYYTMEYVQGVTLADAIDGRPMPPQTAARIALEIANALSFSHERGVLHRDIKPRNILLSTPSGGTPSRADLDSAQVRVADFGLALPIGESISSGDLYAGIAGDARIYEP